MKMPAPVVKVMRTLKDAGYTPYLVGGCVRDALMNKTPHDYDIASNAAPEEVMKLFDKCVPTGKKHGTILVVEDGMPIEVTTFRKDGLYEDHRKPKSVEFVDSIEEDLARRDFTINAMACDLEGKITDPYGGQEDLKKGLIKAVGNPAVRFEEDALRMMRAFRFASKLNFEIDKETRKAIDEKQRLIDEIAPERIAPEIQEILACNPDVLDQMGGLLANRIPELEKMLHTPQNNPHHYTDVLHHTIDALKNSPSKDPAVLWALLLHDAGKPAMKTTDQTGDHFKKHPLESARIAKRVCRDLRLGKKMSREIENLVLYHDAFYAPKLSNIYKIRVARNLPDSFLQKLFAVQEGDILAHTTHERMEQLNAFRDFYEKEKNNRPLCYKDLAINGTDIMENSSLKNKEVQQALKKLLEYMFYHPQENTKEGCLAALKQLESQCKLDES